MELEKTSRHSMTGRTLVFSADPNLLSHKAGISIIYLAEKIAMNLIRKIPSKKKGGPTRSSPHAEALRKKKNKRQQTLSLNSKKLHVLRLTFTHRRTAKGFIGITSLTMEIMLSA